MVFLGKPAVRGLDDLGVRLGIDLEDLVRIRLARIHHPTRAVTRLLVELGRPRPSQRALDSAAPTTPCIAAQTSRVDALPRQRWRLVLARSADAPTLAQRDLVASFDHALEATGLPIARAGRSRAAIVFAAALPTGMPAERELADLLLADRLPIGDVRPRLVAHLPEGFSLVDLHDVWLGEPPLQAQAAGADYRVLLPAGLAAADLAGASEALLARRSIVRTRPKGGAAVEYDLRPLLLDLRIVDAACVRIRVRIHPELGTGRPEEVVAALGDVLGRALEPVGIVRERIVLAGELSSAERVDATGA